MEKFKVSFEANNQQLKSLGTKHASDTYADIEATFVLGEKWTDMDSVSAVWWNDFTRIATVLDSQGKCIVPHEVLARKGCVRVNLVGSIVEGDELVTRLTSYSAEAVQVNEKIKLTGSETSEITPSQYEQFVANVKADADRAEDAKDSARVYAGNALSSAQNALASETNASTSETNAHTSEVNAKASELNAETYKDQAQTYAQNADISATNAENAKDEAIEARDEIRNMSATATTLPAGSSATALYSDGLLSLGIPKGDKGDKGNTGDTGAPAGFGTVSATVDDSIGTPSVEVTASGADTAKNFAFAFHNLKGEKGDKGDTGEVSQAEFDEAITNLKSEISDIAYYEIGKNLYNADEAVTGLLYSDGRVLDGDSYNAYKTSDFIPITEETAYAVSTWRGTSHQNARIITAFYSASKTMLSGAYDNQSGLNVKTVTAPTGASYIRICANETMQLEEGSTATDYEAYKKTLLLNATLPLTEAMQLKVTEDVDALDDVIHTELEEYVKSETGKNKFNPQAAVSGYLGGYNGNIQSSDTYKTTDFIDISGFEYSVCVTGYERFSLQYDENKTPIQTSYRSSAVNNPVISIAEGAVYIRISYYANQEAILQIEDGTVQTAYEPYVVLVESGINCLNDVTKTSVQNLIGNKARNVLYGKKWIPFGDSFTDYTNKTFDSGVFSGKAKTYPRLIAERNEMTIDQKFFMSGRTMAYPADGTFANSATCPTNDGYFQNIPADADYITIMLGINDVNHQSGSGQTPDGEDATGVITLGTIDDDTTATYFGAYNAVLAWIHENRPFAHVGIIVTNGTTRQDYTEAQIALAKKWGYPYINLNGDERTPAFIRCYNPNMPNALKESLKEIQGVNAPTDTHPNWQTHELESTIIENWLRSL